MVSRTIRSLLILLNMFLINSTLISLIVLKNWRTSLVNGYRKWFRRTGAGFSK